MPYITILLLLLQIKREKDGCNVDTCGGMRRAVLHKVRPYDGGHRQYQLVN